ncbi:MAG: deoxyribose-phosphate aldolase [Prevotellaceae bacterium]|jgi:deoxyribose-phosphate aldolase|nr:deoxyribose-phosphate aldolase [Prevotellaceae bacterium]
MNMRNYRNYMEEYGWAADEAGIANAVAEIKNSLPALRTQENWKRCFGAIDLTTLNATDTVEEVYKLTEKVNDFSVNFAGVPPVSAICIYPALVQTVRRALKIPAIQIAAVGAGFPASQTFIKVKSEECRMAVEQGATEMDVVISLGTFLSGDYATVAAEIRQIKAAIAPARLKVILETGALTATQIAIASFIAMEAGADFIKTSTGKMEPAATPAAAWIMTNCIRRFHEKTGKKVGFKPAGGIVSPDDALMYYAIVKKTLGGDWLAPSLFRLGASRAANNLLSSIFASDINYFKR